MSIGQRASYKVRSSFLCYEFGENFARKMFGDEIVDSLPRVTKGKNVGKLKGEITWVKIESGGWISSIGVEKRRGSVVSAQLSIRDYNSGKKTVLFSKELARPENACYPKWQERNHIDQNGWLLCDHSQNDIDQPYTSSWDYADILYNS